MSPDIDAEPASPEFSLKRHPLDWIFILRPVLHPPVWTIIILGYFAAMSSFPVTRLIVIMLIGSAAAGFAYIINQITDIESDRLNNKNLLLPAGIFSIKSAAICAAILAVISIILAITIGWEVCIITCVLLLMAYFYSGKPFYLKNRPVASTAMNAVGHGSLFYMLGYTGAGGGFSVGALLSTPYFFAVAAVFIGTTLPDIKGDALSGKRTPGVVLGTKISINLMNALVATALILALILGDYPMAFICVLSLPFYIYAGLKSSLNSAVLAARISVLFLSLAAAVSFLWYLLLLSLLFVTARLYYRKRFAIDYPSLSL